MCFDDGRVVAKEIPKIISAAKRAINIIGQSVGVYHDRFDQNDESGHANPSVLSRGVEIPSKHARFIWEGFSDNLATPNASCFRNIPRTRSPSPSLQTSGFHWIVSLPYRSETRLAAKGLKCGLKVGCFDQLLSDAVGMFPPVQNCPSSFPLFIGKQWENESCIRDE